MLYYRLYSLDPENGHFTDVSHSVSENDESAILKAESGSEGGLRELWNHGRKVMDFAPRVAEVIALDGPDRLAQLIVPGDRWRWNPLGGHCQLVGSDGAAIIGWPRRRQ